MYQRYKERFGTAGVVIGVIALVLALVTGAYAAGGGLSGKQKKEVEKIAKKYAGKPGAPGAAGAPGTPGTNGAPGKNGTNGTDGKEGPEGSPWTAGGTLPPGKTLEGDWSLGGLATENAQSFRTNVSFGIPLAAAPSVHYLRATGKEPVWVEEEIEPGVTVEEEKEVIQPECPGNAKNPEARPGNLCVYASVESGAVKLGYAHRVLPRICSFGTGGDLACLFSPAPVADKSGFGMYVTGEELTNAEVNGERAYEAWTTPAGGATGGHAHPEVTKSFEGNLVNIPKEVELVGTWAVTAG